MDFKEKRELWTNRDILVVARRITEEKYDVLFEDVQRERAGAFDNEDWREFDRLSDLQKKLEFCERSFEVKAEAISIVKGISYEEAVASMVKGYDD